MACGKGSTSFSRTMEKEFCTKGGKGGEKRFKGKKNNNVLLVK